MEATPLVGGMVVFLPAGSTLLWICADDGKEETEAATLVGVTVDSLLEELIE